MLDDRAAAIRSLGNVFGPDVVEPTRALFSGALRSFPNVDCAIDVGYGEHPRQKMDVYATEELRSGEPAPVVLVVPGGGFSGGDKRSSDEFLGNVGRWFADQGIICAVMNYRLAPEVSWPAGAEDVRSAVEFLRNGRLSIATSDPSKIWILAHSAGANHAATALLDPSLGAELDVAGAVLVSGIYELGTIDYPPGVLAYFGTDPAEHRNRSAQRYAHRGRVPIMLAYAEMDPPWLSMPSLKLAAALTERDQRAAPVIWLRGHNHISTFYSFGTDDEALGREVLDFMRRVEQQQQSDRK